MDKDRERDIHVDYIQIKGAEMEELYLATRKEYTNTERPLDVLIIAGLGDIQNKKSAETFLNVMKEMGPQ